MKDFIINHLSNYMKCMKCNLEDIAMFLKNGICTRRLPSVPIIHNEWINNIIEQS